jgi:SAM-dependent methyltransferase
VSGAWRRIAGGPPGKYSFWKYQWLVHRPVILALERLRAHAHGRLLDVGCGDKPFARHFHGHVTHYFGTDLRGSPYLGGGGPEAYARAEQLPVRTGSMDTVLGLSVMTCLPEPQRLLEEAHRVLRPGGILLLEFEQMVPFHDPPHDYFRFTREGATLLLERAGFEPVELVPVGGLACKVGLSVIAVLNRWNRGPWRPLTELPVRLLYVVLQLGFALLDRVCFDPREVMAHFVVARRR